MKEGPANITSRVLPEYNTLIKGPVKKKLIELARSGISYLDLAKLAKGEIVDRDPSHDFPHTMRVLNLAEIIAKEVGSVSGDELDLDVLRAAVCFHDLLTRPKNDPNSRNDTGDSAQYSGDLLEALGFSSKQIIKTQKAIEQSSFSKGRYPETLEAKILFIADKLDQSGAMAIMRYFSSGGIMNRSFFDSSDPFAKSGRKREALKYTLDALMERIPEIEKVIAPPVAESPSKEIYGRQVPEVMTDENVGPRREVVSTPRSREIIKRRNRFFHRFLEELTVEIEESEANPKNRAFQETGAFAIMNFFDQAGRKGLEFYNPNDPFCKHTRTQPKKHPLDSLVNQQRRFNKALRKDMPADIAQRRKKFLDEFLIEVAMEIDGQ